MSEVISFRLSKNNPREARALKVLKTWQTKGFGKRYIITQALIKLESAGSDDTKSSIELEDLDETLKQMSQLIKQIGIDRQTLPANREKNSIRQKLSQNFVDSIKKAAKPGLNID